MIRLVSLRARVTCRGDLVLALNVLDLIWTREVKAERCCRTGLDIVLAVQTILTYGLGKFKSDDGFRW